MDSEHSIFVGDLAPEVDEPYLLHFFQSYYSSVRSVKIVLDATGRSKGFAFVRFVSEAERDRAANEMNGVFVGSRAVRCRVATAAQSRGGGGGGPAGGERDRERDRDRAAPPPITGPDDPSNTTLFVGGLSASVSEEQLRMVFMPFGEVSYTKIPPGKGCGFVHYLERRAAEFAIKEMNGVQLGGSSLRVTWGKSVRPPGAGGGGGGGGRGGDYPPPSSSYPPYGSAPPPHHGTYPPPYDPYGGYGGGYDAYYGGGYGMDPYGYGAYHAGPHHRHDPHGERGEAPVHIHAGVPTIYDPLRLPPVDQLNSDYMHRTMERYTGSFLLAGAPAKA